VDDQRKKPSSPQPASGPARWRPIPQRADQPTLTAEQQAMVDEHVREYGRFTNEGYRDLQSQ
jgi:hypothetical protein